MPTPFDDAHKGEKTLRLGAVGETRLIAHIREWLGDVCPPAPRGSGDDCAVLPAQPLPGKRLATVDSVIWGQHFDAAVAAFDAGAKLVKRNLSDIAAMGGTPADALLSLVCGKNTALAWLADFFAGVAAVCRANGVELAGGDVAAAPDNFFCATLALTGFAEHPLLRLAARAGDTLLVTGDLGGSLAGKHFAFEPRLAQGRWLAAQAGVHAAMDISDGLAKDLPAMLPSGCDAVLEAGALPVSAAALEAAAPLMCAEDVRGDALWRALCDGEDYELLVAAAPESVPDLLTAWRKQFPALAFAPIGKIVPAAPGHPGGKLRWAHDIEGEISRARGYTHFA
ncbi:MAG: thiamine-phosphate kinase [Puniceicoccales bacterium]|jgi:thiamine-monophosphate kinase|nr:thiamine-phosphate kinase [Puniceicoccales bacterium]